MHSGAVGGSSAVSAFLPHHRPPTPTTTTTSTLHRHRHTPPPLLCGLSQRAGLSVSHSGRMQLFSCSSDKRRERHYLLCVDMTIVWIQRASLTTGLFPYVAQAEHTRLFECVCVCVSSAGLHAHMLPCDVKLAHGSIRRGKRLNNYDELSRITRRAPSD